MSPENQWLEDNSLLKYSLFGGMLVFRGVDFPKIKLTHFPSQKEATQPFFRVRSDLFFGI